MNAAAASLLLLLVGSLRTTLGAVQLLGDAEGGVHEVDLSVAPPPGALLSVEANVTFKLFTRLNPDEAQVMRVNDSSSLGNFNPAWPTRMTAHGWQGAESSFTSAKDAWLSVGDCNVIMVDWSELAADINYVLVKSYVEPVGRLGAALLEWLVAARGLRLADVALVGHSMGGHVVGLVGSSLLEAGAELPLLTALDPARPLFEDEDPALRLDASDAALVQVIHTNAGNLGLVQPAGHIDFYPNGGEVMPGCEPDYIGTCSHTRSREYFAESVTHTDGFVGFACANWTLFDSCVGGDDWALMGDGVSPGSGSYYLRTAASPPFALGFQNLNLLMQ